jgi:hypothetical protein
MRVSSSKKFSMRVSSSKPGGIPRVRYPPFTSARARQFVQHAHMDNDLSFIVLFLISKVQFLSCVFEKTIFSSGPRLINALFLCSLPNKNVQSKVCSIFVGKKDSVHNIINLISH